MDTQKRLHENISALVDGELALSEVELAFAELDTPEGRVAWNVYHQIGHTLRSDRCGYELSGQFAAGLADRLAAEDALQAAPSSGEVTGLAASSASDAVTILP